MATVAEVLAKHRVDLDEDTLAVALDAAMSVHAASLRTRVRGSALPHRDRELLAAGGLELGAAGAAQVATTEALGGYLALLAGALPVGTVAARLGIHPSRVRHRVAARELYALKVGGRLLLPAFQFGPDGAPLPGLDVVLAALPEDLHPLEVEGFFATPQPELELVDRARTPAAWLLGGGDPQAAAALAAVDLP